MTDDIDHDHFFDYRPERLADPVTSEREAVIRFLMAESGVYNSAVLTSVIVNLARRIRRRDHLE